MDGIGLAAQATDEETVKEGPRCSDNAPLREYEVVAINVEITLNRYLDYDPEGRMYVLAEELERVRAEEQRNAGARTNGSEPGVSLGLQGDAIQPLTLRVNQGECLRISLRNELEGEAASFHIHGSTLLIEGSDDPAIATNPDSFAAPGETVDYEWMVAEDEPEGTHYVHSHGDAREQTVHGLFGAVIVELAGSRFLDPETGEELRSGWSAIIEDRNGEDFREFGLYYHEVGDENYQFLDKEGEFVPQVDPTTSAYRPGARALNYRSEPFLNRLQLQEQLTGRFDESVAYSSYVFGDPATPIMRSYLGDPVKERIIHGGSEVFHVHHVHGGAVRWRRQPDAEDTNFATGLDKHPPILPAASERLDSQGIGPSETYDVENECGSGGCQQSVGDFLVHCHVAHHYFAGMWGLWRVYNTLQDGQASTDSLPPLAELPDRKGGVAPAVDSSQLVGTSVDWSGERFDITAGGLAEWVQRQLPPRGRPKGYDASVLDWSVEGNVFVNEPETQQAWPGYHPAQPGSRPPFPFDPKTGKLAYPFLRPHFGKRPPFAPGHGPAPYLDPPAEPSGIPPPGTSGPASVCPDGTSLKSFSMEAIALPITQNERANIVDPNGELYVLKEQEEAVRANNDLRVPLTIRANAGEDCVDVTLTSTLEDSPDNHGFAKVNTHIHFVQFDVQASDGVIAGFNYEQSVRPFTVEGQRVVAAAASGASSIQLDGAERFQPGILVGVGMDEDETFEVREISSVSGSTVTFDEPLEHAHAQGEIVSTEFVRYRWYPDVQFGTAYFHDHVNALKSWRHGLVGALVSEPPGSTYHDPHSGEPIDSGPIADIRTEAPVSADVTGSFREFALFIQDDNPPVHIDRSSGSAINLRAEPIGRRPGDPSRAFSSTVHGDPATPLLEAYVGDPMVLRALVGGTNDTHTLHVDGHWFRIEPYSLTSPPTSTAHLGISERYDLVIPRAGGPQQLPGDYLYYNGRSFKLLEGSWGLLRVLDGEGGLQRLPGRDPPAPPELVCPAGESEKSFSVAAIEVDLPMLGRGTGKIFVLDQDKAAVRSGERLPEPLVLHVNVGDCVRVELRNETDGPVSFHADMLAYDPADSAGVEAGRMPPQAIPTGASRTYTFFASQEVGETVALIRDWGDVTENPGLGLYGAIVVGPEGATYRDVYSDEDVSLEARWQVNVFPSDGEPYRDYSLFLQDEDESIGTHRMPYTTEVSDTTAINYQSAPLEDRLDADGELASPFLSSDARGDPPTPLVEAYAGESMLLRVIAPWSEQAQVFTIEGHEWPFEPGREGSDRLSSVQLGGAEAITLRPEGGAGGLARIPGDYLYGNHREPYREAGQWGLLRVRDPDDPGGSDLLQLECGRVSCDEGMSTVTWMLIGTAAVAGVAAGALAFTRWRKRSRSPGEAQVD
jgi:FtsP/CotA-like multicopper oxidase with cupredoxin domain